MSQSYCQFAFIVHLKDENALAEFTKQYATWTEELFKLEEVSPGFILEAIPDKPTQVVICNEPDFGDPSALMRFLEQPHIKNRIAMEFLSFPWVVYNDRGRVGEQAGGAVFWDLLDGISETTNLDNWLDTRYQQFQNRRKLQKVLEAQRK